MAKKRKAFLFDPAWLDALADLDPSEQIEIIRAISEYAESGCIPCGLSSAGKVALRMIAPALDHNADAYRRKCDSIESARKKNSKSRPAALPEPHAHESSEISEGGSDFSMNGSEISMNCSDFRNESSEISEGGSEISEGGSDFSMNGSEISSDNDNDIYYSLSLPRAREKILDDFFSNTVTLAPYFTRWDTSPAEMRRLAEEIVDSWIISGIPRKEKQDARSHLFQALRLRYQQKHNDHDKAQTPRQPSGRSNTHSLPAEPGYGLVGE